MTELWEGLVGLLASILETFHNVVEPATGVFAWGWAIIMLTLLVRVVLLPLAIKQTTSMRAMQGLQPEIKRIQAKYKADKGMMRSDPERYRELRSKQQEEQAALFKERGVNPAASCLPLVAQMPIFFALFQVLNDERWVPEMVGARFYLIDPLSLSATQGAGIGAYIIALMGITTFLQQWQMARSNPAMQDNPQQRVLLYAMPIMLTVFGINFPAGVLLYWVTTNLWTMGQQYFMFRALGPAPTGGAATPTAGTPKSRRNQDARQEATEVDSGTKDPQAPKGAPTPKRNDARSRNRNTSSTGGRNNGSGKGGTSARARQKRR
jgi:YidC/Oxa1 family membrane protein insertase